MRTFLLILSFSLLSYSTILAQIENIDRQEVVVPDIPGYQTLKCDFHIHTIFSDGTVWPSVRVTEAWEYGYDAIAITDHIEGKPYRKYVPIDYNAPNEIAQQEGDIKDIIVIGGVEITRNMPPGHMNAIFIEDANEIVTERIRERFQRFKDITSDYHFVDSIDRAEKDYLNALNAVEKQNGFVFWNHPGPPGKYDSLTLYDEHIELFEQGLLHGVEVSGWGAYWPEAFQWCLDYDLTLLSNSDYHYPHSISNKSSRSDRRNITLVFAKERTAESIQEALVEKRTAIWVNDLIIGREEHLKPLFYNAVEVSAPHYVDARRKKYVKIKNTSDFLLEIEFKSGAATAYFDDMILKPRSSQILVFDTSSDKIEATVRNFHITPEDRLEVIFELKQSEVKSGEK
jgi:hypothetical protein